MKKRKCDVCKGKGKIKYKKEGLIKPLVGLCGSCWGQGFREVKTVKELEKIRKKEYEIADHSGKL